MSFVDNLRPTIKSSIKPLESDETNFWDRLQPVEDRKEDRFTRLDKMIAQAEKQEATPIGKFMGILTSKQSDRLKGERARFSRYEEEDLTKGQKIAEEFKVAAKDVITDTARFAPWVLPTKKIQALSKLGKIGKVAQTASQALQTSGIIGGARFVEELAKGDDIETSAGTALKSGVDAGAISLALPLIPGGLKALKKGVTNLLQKNKKGIGKGLAVLNSVPSKTFEWALDEQLAGKNIFKGKFDEKIFDKLGKKAQGAINNLLKKEGEKVGLQRTILRESTGKVIDTNVFKAAIDDFLRPTTIGKISSLEAKDVKIISEIKNVLTKPKKISLAEAQIIKQKINNKIKFKTETVRTPSSEGQGILKQIASLLDSEISTRSPKYAKINKEFSEIAKLRDKIQRHLKDESVERNLKNLYNENKGQVVRDLFEELDDLAAPKDKFINELKRNTAREAYETLIPKGGFFSRENFLRAMLLFVAPPFTPLGATALTSFSPKFTKQLLTRPGQVSRGVKKISRLGEAIKRPAAILGSRLFNDEEKK